MSLAASRWIYFVWRRALRWFDYIGLTYSEDIYHEICAVYMGDDGGTTKDWDLRV